MKTQHTPGPWQRNGTHIRYQQNPGGYRFDVAEVFRDVGSETANANARLIAAAPELAEALRALTIFFGTYNGDGSRAVLNRARDLLAKIEGREG